MKRKYCALAASIGIFFVVDTALADRDSDYRRIEAGFAIAEQQGLNLDRADPAVGLGSYLVNQSGCNDCHTWPNYATGGDPYQRQPARIDPATYLGGGRVFALPTENVCSRNITPSPANGLPAGLTRSEFLYVIHTGCDPQDANFADAEKCELLQVMPWPNYAQATSKDLNAIYSYLAALPHAQPGPEAQCKPDPQGVK